MKLSDLNILPDYPIISVGPFWIDGKHYELGADGDTLIETQETDAQRAYRLSLIESFENIKQQKPTA